MSSSRGTSLAPSCSRHLSSAIMKAIEVDDGFSQRLSKSCPFSTSVRAQVAGRFELNRIDVIRAVVSSNVSAGKIDFSPS